MNFIPIKQMKAKDRGVLDHFRNRIEQFDVEVLS